MHDIRAIRENPTAYAAALSRRPTVDGASEVQKILGHDRDMLAFLQRKQAVEAERKQIASRAGAAKSRGETELFDDLRNEAEGKRSEIESWTQSETTAKQMRDDLLARLPNIPLENVPYGRDEHGNQVVRVWDDGPREEDHRPSGLKSGANLNKPKDHADIGETLGMMDFEAATRMSGARFVVLRGQLARLERALAAFMLDIQTIENGYIEHATPLLVRDNALFGTGQLPKFADDQFTATLNLPDVVAMVGMGLLAKYSPPQTLDLHSRESGLAINQFVRSTLDGLRRFGEMAPVGHDVRSNLEGASGGAIKQLTLIPTAEVSLTNIYREQIVDAATLPSRMTAATPCFRSEAGSAGRDTKGMIRMHQFIKVELVSITKPEESEAEHERMTRCAEGILERLGLPYRTVLLCTGDMGFGARKTYDLEVWLPSQNTYREISSCSNCGDFQARRMDAKFRREQGAKPEFVHTLNGSGLAVGRTLVAVLENYQREDGKVDVPDALRDYMGGLKVIG
jgi:seryl-tRNA synthetase